MSAPITRNLTILLTDIKGFTDKTSQKSRAEIQQMLDKHKEIVLRSFFSLVSGYCLGLGYLWSLWERDGRGWHDLMAGTRVVQVQ